LDEADRGTVIRNFLFGEYGDAFRVVAFNGWSRNVSEDIAGEIIDRAYDAGETLTQTPSVSSTGALIRSGGRQHRRRGAASKPREKRQT
jgi:hypothetical protein